MTFAVKVEGGTGAGRKRPLRDKPADWIHVCQTAPLSGGRELAGYLTRCPDCGTRRPGT
jgi:hypothetical protein